MNPLALLHPHLSDNSLHPLVQDAPLDIPLTLQASRIMAPALTSLIRAIRALGKDRLVQTAP